MRKWMLIMFAFGVFLLAGCETSALAKPKNLQINQGVATWDAVSDADGYIVIVGTTEHAVTVTTFDLNTLNLTIGNYDITVVAKKGTTLSGASNKVVFAKQSGNVTLAAPNVVLTNSILTWQAVENASAYEISINNQTYTTTGLSYDLSTLTLPEGSYTVTIKAVSGQNKSQPSATKTFAKGVQLDQAVLYGTLLAMVEPTYVPNMSKNDFQEEMDYQSYMNTSVMVHAFLDVAVSTQMSQIEVLGFMTYLMSFGEFMEEPDGALILDRVFEIGAYGMTEERFVKMVLGLSEQMLTINNDETNAAILDAEDMVDYYSGNLTTIKTSIGLTSELASLSAYLNPEQIALLLGILDVKIDTRLFEAMRASGQNYLGNYEQSFYDYIYQDETDEYIFLFNDIIGQIAGSNQTLLNQIATDPYQWMPKLNDYFYIINEYNNAVETHNELVVNQQAMALMVQAFAEEKVYLETMMGEITNYFVDLYQVMPESLVDDLVALLGSETVTPSEVIILKNEITQMLITQMPEVESFVAFNTALMMLYGGLFDVNMIPYVAHATTLSNLERTNLQIILLFIDSIQVKQIDEIMLLTADLKAEGHVDEYYNYIQGETNYVRAAELIMYFTQYIHTFKTDNQLLFDKLNAIETNQMMTDFATLASVMLKSQIEATMSPQEFAMASTIIDQAIIDMPVYLKLAEDFKALGLDLFDIFATQGEEVLMYIANYMMQTQQNSQESPDPSTEIDFIEGLFSYLSIYHTPLNLALKTTLVSDFVSVARVPLLALSLQKGLSEAEFNLMYQRLNGDIKTLLLNVIKLEGDLYTVITQMTDIYLTMTSYGIDMDLATLAIVSLIAEDLLTISNQTMIELSIEILFETILQDPTLLPLLDLNILMVTDMQTQTLDLYTQFKDDLLVIAKYDFANLSQLQIDYMHDLMLALNPGPKNQPS